MAHVRFLPPVMPLAGVLSTLLVVVALLVVHAARVSALAGQKPAPSPVAIENAALPRSAANMREAILHAVESGRLADLKAAIELNEMRPDIADAAVTDVIAYFKALSKDGEGKDILAVLGKVLATRPAVVPFGRDIENNAIYVWPYLAERDLTTLSEAEQADLKALVGEEEATALKAAKRWAWWRVAIGADGTWHAFRKEK